MSAMPTFARFFELAHGRPPFPWQARLADEVLERGWPELLDLPTGVGKTSALDVALYALAVAPERMPRRTILVVDRRIVVDQGAQHARGLLAALSSAPTGPLADLADRLRTLWGAHPHDPPFAVALMRGGMPRDNDWARRPDQPVLGVSTVDQVGSRLLFRGYGLSARSAPIHAGLVGNDTLLLLDEVHLAEPFAQTLSAIEERRTSSSAGLPDRFRVVRMSATPGDDGSPRRFTLAEEDRAHPVLARRLAARKPARLISVRVTGDDEAKKLDAMARAAIEHASALQREGATVVGVVLNRVDSARRAYALIRAERPDVDAILVTGRMRPIDRDRLVREALMPRCGPRDRRRGGDRPLVVVATQCIEAGADLDFDGLVTECASLDALRQRFGRLDRQGARGESHAVVLARSDQTGPAPRPDPVYGDALGATWAWLGDVARSGVVDFGIGALPDGAPESTLAPRPNAPVLLPVHLDAWAQTAPVPDFDPDVALWLHGPARATADVQLVWRRELVLPTDADADSALASAITLLAARRPSALEAMSLPIGAARRWLADEEPASIADVVSSDVEVARRRARDAESDVVALRWRGDESEWVRPDDLRPGDVIVVPCARGGIAGGSFDPASTDEVRDLGAIAALRGRGELSMRLEPGSLVELGGDPIITASTPLPDADESFRETRLRLREWADALPDRPSDDVVTQDEWRATIETLRGSTRGRLLSLPQGAALFVASVPRRLLRGEVEDAFTEDEDSSFTAREVTLRSHSEDVRALAERFARAVGLSDPLVGDVALAAWLHDVGKADPRFQRWLAGGAEITAARAREPLAKSSLSSGSRAERQLARDRAGYPAGYRHELLSLALAEASPAACEAAHDRDLVLHLVASHHGWCRPFAPFVDDEEEIAVELEHGAVALRAGTRHRRARLDSGVAERFWRLVDRYGWWGLAWLEAIVRLADHRASAGDLEVGDA